MFSSSPVQEQACMLKKDVRVLRLRSVTGIRIHHELSVRQVLGQEESVDRWDDDVFASTHDQSRW